MATLIAEGMDDENENSVVSDNDDNHFLGGAINPEDLQPAGIQNEDEEKPCTSFPPKDETPAPCVKEEVEAEAIKEASKTNSRSGIDYKGIWLNNNMPCVVAQINSGKLLKGNIFFMKFVCEWRNIVDYSSSTRWSS